MSIKNQLTTPLEISSEFMINSKVIVKSIKGPDDPWLEDLWTWKGQ